MKHVVTAWASMLTAATFVGGSVLGAPGDFDASYGQHGRSVVVSPTPGLQLVPNRFIQQSDGKTVIVGWTEQPVGSPQDFAVVRLDTDGALDSTFGGNGVVTINFGTLDQGLGIVQQPDNKLVVVGITNNAPGGTCPINPCAAVARLNEDGSLDDTFGGATGKVVVTSPGALQSVAVDVAMQGSNLIVAGHKAFNDFVFMRLTSSGTVDATFNAGNNGGVSVIDLGDPILMTRVIGLADGGFAAVGGANANAANKFKGIVRVTSEGVLDTSFGGTGIVTDTCVGPCQWLRVVQQWDGKLLLTGFDSKPATGSPPLQEGRSLLERRNLDGSLDAGFGSGGRLIDFFISNEPHPVTTGEVATSAVVDPVTHNITVTGRMTGQSYSTTGGSVNSMVRSPLARFTSSGALDTSFGSNGLRMLPYSAGPISLPYGFTWYNLDLRSDGRIMALGSGSISNAAGTVTDKAMAVARLSSSAPDSGLLAVTGSSTTENSGNAWVVVSRAGGSTGSVSVSYTTVSGSAVAGSDFVSTSGTLTWADGDVRTKIIRVPLIADAVTEPTSEAFNVVLSNPTGGADIADSSATVTIVRDDVAPTNGITVVPPSTNVFETSGNIVYTVTRTGTDPISVNYTTAWDAQTSPVAESPSDYTHVNGVLVWGTGDTAPKTITIPVVNDAVAEPAEELSLVFFLEGGGAVTTNGVTSVTIHNGGPPQISIATSASANENQATATVNVTRAGPTTATVSVNYATSGGTATAGTDYATTTGTLTWLPGDPDIKTISIPLSNDAIFEGDETVAVTLSNAGGGATLGTTTSILTIVEDDPAPVIAVSNTTVSTSESQTTIAVNVTRTGSTTQSHSINFATAGGSATSGLDFVSTSGSLTWLPGDSDTKTITIPLVGDAMFEGNETFTLTLSNPTSGATLGASTATITIVEDDVAPPPPSGGGKGGGALSLAWLTLLGVLLSMHALRRSRIRILH